MATTSEKERFACELCLKVFSDRSNLRKHVNVIHENIQHTCSICTEQFYCLQTLKQHIESVHEELRISNYEAENMNCNDINIKEEDADHDEDEAGLDCNGLRESNMLNSNGVLHSFIVKIE